MKKRCVIVLSILFLIVFSFLCGMLWNRITFTPAGQMVSNTGAKPSVEYAESIVCMEGTTPAMLYPEYWMGHNPDSLLFTAEEIQVFNQNNPAFVLYRNEDDIERRLRPSEVGDSLKGQIIYSLLEPEKIDQLLENSTSVYVNHAIPDLSYWLQLDENRNLDTLAMEQEIPIQYAVCVERTVAMGVPSDDFVSENPDEMYCNDMVSAEVMPGCGVIVLHESKDKEWLYILNGSYCGWVHKDMIALCANRSEWEATCNPEKFLIVTGNEIVLDATVEASASARKILPMGTKLALAETSESSLNGREVLGCYVVLIPARDAQGKLYFEETTIPMSLDVHEGYLAMTSDSVIQQAFKFLGHIYGWGGSFSSNDCSGMVRQVYACYGFQLPRNARAIAEMADLGAFDCEKMQDSKKYSVLSQMPAGLLLFMDGHLMIYLGIDEGVPYVISSCSSYIPLSSATTTAEDVRYANCIFVSNLELLRRSGNTWFEEIKFFDWKEY